MTSISCCIGRANVSECPCLSPYDAVLIAQCSIASWLDILLLKKGQGKQLHVRGRRGYRRCARCLTTPFLFYIAETRTPPSLQQKCLGGFGRDTEETEGSSTHSAMPHNASFAWIDRPLVAACQSHGRPHEHRQHTGSGDADSASVIDARSVARAERVQPELSIWPCFSSGFNRTCGCCVGYSLVACRGASGLSRKVAAAESAALRRGGWRWSAQAWQPFHAHGREIIERPRVHDHSCVGGRHLLWSLPPQRGRLHQVAGVQTIHRASRGALGAFGSEEWAVRARQSSRSTRMGVLGGHS